MLAELLRHPVVPWIATYLAHSTILCAAAWGFELWSRRTPAHERTLGIARERLWKLALFLPLFSTFAQCAGGFSLWHLPAEAAHVHLSAAGGAAPASSLPALVLETGPLAPAPGLQFTWAMLAMALWITGVLWGAFVWLREWHALGRAVRGLRPNTDPELQLEFDTLRKGDPRLSGARLFIGRNALVPLTLGWTRMSVVVPERAARELDPDECRAMLGHELAHARRRDPLWISAARAVESLFFFQPLNRLARIKLQDEAEFLADRWALERGVEPLSLASCLTEVAGWVVSQRRALPVPSMAARGARLTRRVERLLEERRAPLPLRTAPWSLAFLFCALGSAAAAVPGQAAPAPILRETASLSATAPAVATDERDAMAAQFESLAGELDALAEEAGERELDAGWYRRLAVLRLRLDTLQASYAALMELARKSSVPPEPATAP